MFPVWLVLFFGALVMSYNAVLIPAQEARMTEIAANVSATNFLAYRQALIRYMGANPSATGAIPDAALNGYWPSGYIRDTRWANVVQNNVPFVYAVTEPAPGTLEMLYGKTSESLLVGRKNAGTSALDSYKGFINLSALPAAIPGGAIVMMGY